jgi:hypothetical protein
VKEMVGIGLGEKYQGANLPISDLLSVSSACMGILSLDNTLSDSERNSFVDTAVKLLKKAIDSGYQDLSYLQRDPDFEWLQKSDSMQEIESYLRAKLEPNR